MIELGGGTEGPLRDEQGRLLPAAPPLPHEKRRARGLMYRWGVRLGLAFVLSFGLVGGLAPSPEAWALCPGSLCRPEGALLLAEYAAQGGGVGTLSGVGGSGTTGPYTPTRTILPGEGASKGVNVKPKAGGRWGFLANLAMGVLSMIGLVDAAVELAPDFTPPSGGPGGLTDYSPLRAQCGGSSAGGVICPGDGGLGGVPYGGNTVGWFARLGSVTPVDAGHAVVSVETGGLPDAVWLYVFGRTPTGFEVTDALRVAATGGTIQVAVEDFIDVAAFPGSVLTGVGLEVSSWTDVSVSFDEWRADSGSIWWKAPTPSAPETGTVTSTVWCKSADGAVAEVTQTITDIVLEAGTEFPLPDVECPLGSVATETESKWIGDSTGSVQEIIPRTQSPDWVKAIPDQYPECITGNCVLTLKRTIPDEGTVECLQATGAWAEACNDWTRKPRDQFKCMWGPYTVPVSYCRVYEKEPNPGPRTPTADPEGEPKPDPLPPPDEVNPEGGDDGCFPTGWGVFNPVSWVLQPVKCALEWAFVPKSASAQLGELQARIGDRVPFSLVGAVAGYGSGLGGIPASTPCPDWDVKVGPVDTSVICESSFTSAVRSARPFLYAGMVLAAFAPLARSVFYASFPILPLRPSK